MISRSDGRRYTASSLPLAAAAAAASSGAEVNATWPPAPRYPSCWATRNTCVPARRAWPTAAWPPTATKWSQPTNSNVSVIRSTAADDFSGTDYRPPPVDANRHPYLLPATTPIYLLDKTYVVTYPVTSQHNIVAYFLVNDSTEYTYLLTL